jgi:hypothetical protein
MLDVNQASTCCDNLVLCQQSFVIGFSPRRRESFSEGFDAQRFCSYRNPHENVLRLLKFPGIVPASGPLPSFVVKGVNAIWESLEIVVHFVDVVAHQDAIEVKCCDEEPARVSLYGCGSFIKIADRTYNQLNAGSLQ